MSDDHDSNPVYAQHQGEQASLRSYVIGFVLSIVFTLTAFSIAEIHVHSMYETFTRPLIIGVTAMLAIMQFFVQIYFFLHLGKETRPRWKLLVLGFMVLVVFILVFGSMWIMYNLNYRMTPTQINQYMINQNGGI